MEIKEQEVIIEEEPKEPEPWYKGPIRYILMVFLLLLVVLWIFPHYSVKLDPEPKNIPKLEDVLPKDIEIDETAAVKISKNLVKPNSIIVKQVADRIATISCNSNKICQAKAIFYFVRDNFDYVSDPNAFEYVKTAEQSLVSGGGDCDDASVLLANLLESIGIETRFVLVPNHVYVQANIPDALRRYKSDADWVSLDATCNTCAFGEIPYKNVNKVVGVIE